ncbi:MAG: TraR/DksA family transcriptional regulator [Candidatus Aureabacteria bacterium]|nr:TraR/DksA family transcriptional regulator [Candidatus Auribacterota bacterium]
MDPNILDELRQQLLALREKALEEMSALEHGTLNQSPRDQAGDLSGYGIHIADAATDSYDREFNLSLVSHEQDILNDIEDALGKVERKEYGSCELCEEPIGESRLRAVPYARLCLRCKETQEKKPAEE